MMGIFFFQILNFSAFGTAANGANISTGHSLNQRQKGSLEKRLRPANKKVGDLFYMGQENLPSFRFIYQQQMLSQDFSNNFLHFIQYYTIHASRAYEVSDIRDFNKFFLRMESCEIKSYVSFYV